MLKTASLGKYWQDGSGGSSFTRVRCISTGQVTPQVYGYNKAKGRAFSVPDTSCKKFLHLKKKSSVQYDESCSLLIDSNGKDVISPSYSCNSSNSSGLNELGGGGNGGGLLVCTLDTEQNGEDGDSVGRLHSRNGSVDMVTAQNVVNTSTSTWSSSCTSSSGGARSSSHASPSSVRSSHTIPSSTPSSNISSRLSSSQASPSSVRSSSHTSPSSTQVGCTSPSPPPSPAPISTTHSCRTCGNTLEPTDLVVMFDTDTYHLGCFSCGQCSKQVDPAANFLVLEDGSPLCVTCSPVCHVCEGKILNGHINVLNKDFHEQCLKCFVCKKAFGPITKVYATSGEPCCAECVTPVFSDTWSSRGSTKPHPRNLSSCEEEEEEEEEESTLPSGTRVSAGGNHTLPPRLQSLSKAITDLPDSRFHSLLRPSFSVPMALSDSPKSGRRLCRTQMSLSSLKAIVYDELGVSLLMNFCVEDCSIEYVVFWLDVEHFKHFDGNDDDMKLFAHHIMLKYIGYYAELPINLSKEIEDNIVAGMQETSVSQDLFNEAQESILEKMEKELQPKFLRSSEGQKYLEALVNRDIKRRKKKRQLESQATTAVKAIVTSFDKRHLNTKYYVYEIQVEDGEMKYMIYRRYSEFHSLHQALKCSFPDTKLTPMPKKIYFGRSQTRTVAKQRMKELESYLQGLLNLQCEISQSPILRQFLTQTTADKDDEAFNSRIRNTSDST